MKSSWFSFIIAMMFACGSPPIAVAQDAVQQLEHFVNQHISSKPRKMGVVRVLIEDDGSGDAVRFVEFVHPFSALRDAPSARAVALNWASHEDVRVRIRVGKTAEEWKYAICRPMLDTSRCY